MRMFTGATLTAPRSDAQSSCTHPPQPESRPLPPAPRPLHFWRWAASIDLRANGNDVFNGRRNRGRVTEDRHDVCARSYIAQVPVDLFSQDRIGHGVDPDNAVADLLKDTSPPHGSDGRVRWTDRTQ